MTVPMGLSPDDLALLAELWRGGEMIFDNARQLCNEARFLRKNEAVARAVCLHQLSNEECGKIELLGWWAMSVVLGQAIDVAHIGRALTDHKAKNDANAYFSGVTDDERRAREQADWATASEIFRRRKAEIHELFNEHKNAALYVNFQDGRFSAPKDVITEVLADEMAILNDYFLGIAANNVRPDSKSVARYLHAIGDADRCEPANGLAALLDEKLLTPVMHARQDVGEGPCRLGSRDRSRHAEYQIIRSLPARPSTASRPRSLSSASRQRRPSSNSTPV